MTDIQEEIVKRPGLLRGVGSAGQVRSLQRWPRLTGPDTRPRGLLTASSRRPVASSCHQDPNTPPFVHDARRGRRAQVSLGPLTSWCRLINSAFIYIGPH